MSGKRLKLYLDLCVYNRPFDNQGNERIALETSAFIYILEKVENLKYTLVVSDALIYENNANPDEQRKMRVNSYFQLSHEFVSAEDSDFNRVKFLKKFGFSDIDALHIVLAEKSNVDFFITCDDDIIRLYKKNNDSISVKILSILEFVAKEVK